MQNHDLGIKGDGQSESSVPSTEEKIGPEIQAQLKPASRRRSDKSQLHATRHGVLSRHPLEALARSGENIRQLRRIERMLRAELQPSGIVAEMMFDRMWSSYLRCLLISRTEADLVMPVDQSTDDPRGLPKLQEAGMPTLIWPEHGTTNYGLSIDLMKYLLIVQKYDCHFSREFYRAMGLLLALRSGGKNGLTRLLAKTFGANIEISENTDE